MYVNMIMNVIMITRFLIMRSNLQLNEPLKFPRANDPIPLCCVTNIKLLKNGYMILLVASRNFEGLRVIRLYQRICS